MAVARLQPREPGAHQRGVLSNQRLTALTGAVLIAGLAVIGVAILRFHSLFTLHMFVGVVLVGPLCLKLGSTSYRLAGYYGGRDAYREDGPPHIGFRVLAPPLVACTLGLFGTGGLMLILGPSSRHTLGLYHKVFFVLWFGFVTLHVLGHLPDLLRVLREERSGLRARRLRDGRLARFAAIGAALAAGLVLALLLKGDMSKIAQSRAAEHRGTPVGAVRDSADPPGRALAEREAHRYI